MTPDKAQRLRALAALVLTERTPDGPCPSNEELGARHGGALNEADMQRVTAHIAHCQRCYTLYAGLLALEPQHDEAMAPAHQSASRLRHWLGTLRGPRLAGALATVLVAGVIGIGLLQSPGQPSALPGYEITLAGKLQMRGEASAEHETVQFDPGNEFTLLLRPQDALEGSITARAYVRTDGKIAPLIAPAPQITPKGVVLITGEVGGDVRLPAGESVLLVVIGRTDALPDADELSRALAAQSSVRKQGWAAWRVPLEVVK